MKKLFVYVVMCSIAITFLSCDNEKIEDEPEEKQEELTEEPEIPIVEIEPCLYSDFIVEANSEVTVDCLLDLEGKNIEVPSGVTFKYDGGDVFNGTLNFTSAGLIDGELLNSKLTVEGDVKLTSDEFTLHANRWGILETDSDATVPTDEEAHNNHLILQGTVDFVNSLGATTVNISEMDAYFFSATEESISVRAVLSLPSDFNLKMSNNTVLRVFPTDFAFSSKMIKVDNKDNVTICGGKIIGDRLLHGPTYLESIKGNNTLVDIVGARNVTVENMYLTLGFTGLTVYGHSWHDYPDQVERPYIPSEDIIIRNNTCESNQSNNLSVTDGYRILIEGNKLYNAGNDLESTHGLSKGWAPKIGIVIEPAYNGPGKTQKIGDVDIINNIVEGGGTNAILALGVIGVNIIGNTADAAVGWTTASNVTVSDNTINGSGINGGSYFEGFPNLERSTDNVISNNKISNANTGIDLTNDDIEVYGNEIINCGIGIMMMRLFDTKIYNNTITNTVDEESWGINSQFYVNNVELYNNTITLKSGLAMDFIGINNATEEEQEYQVNLHENYFDTTKNLRVSNSHGIHFDNNEFENAGITYAGSSNSSLTNNTINAKSEFALNINRTSSAKNIIIKDNHISNTNTNRLGGYGVRINIVNNPNITLVIEDANIEIIGNTISSVGDNYGFHSTNFDGLTITNNTIQSESADQHPFYFMGNNSEITNNTIINANKEYQIEGNNNIVSGNISNP